MQRRDHHDWASETYVEEWVRRQQAEDPSRAERFEEIRPALERGLKVVKEQGKLALIDTVTQPR